MRPSPTPNRSTDPREASVSKSFRPRLARSATAGLIAAAILGTTGCKSMPFTLPKPSLPKLAMPSIPKLEKPDVSKLAFWKSENLMPKKGKLPKPPSLSFDPSPIKQALASSKDSAIQGVDSLRSQTADAIDQSTAPIRQPYKLAAKSAVDKIADKSKLDFDPGYSRGGSPKSDVVDSNITKAQRDFQAALASSSQAIEKSIGGKVADLKSAENEFKLPNSIKSAKTNVDDSLMAVNRSLYNAKGKLAAAADNAVDKASDQIGSSTKGQLSMFEQRLKQAAEKAEAVPSQIASAASKTASNAFGGIAPPKPATGLSANNNFAKASPVAPAATANAQVSSEVAELKAELAKLRSEQQKLMQQQQLAATQAPAATQPSASMPNFQSPPVANEFVANLTARPSQAQSALPPTNSSARTAPSYPQMYPSTTPLRTASSTNNVVSSAPQNVLRRNFSPVANQGTEYPSHPAANAPMDQRQPTAHPGSGYPSTPYSSYGAPSGYSASATPAHTESTRASQASFQQHGDSNLVITASTPVEPAQQHVSEVNIPDAVLQGTSNYAPGTVHPLR